jgi:2-polyprenyl-3-methyl-5-hydroxy-6-metoxy-1,4-benzoquinol methylase
MVYLTDTPSPVASAGHMKLSYLAEPAQAPDWRLVVVYAAAAETGLLNALPGAPSELAARARLNEVAVRDILEALATFGIVELAEGRYVRTAAAATVDDDMTLRHHAWVIRRWATELESRLRGLDVPPATPMSPELLKVFLGFLATDARRRIPPAVDACVARYPQAQRVLDVGGGHGELALAFAKRGLHATLQDFPATIEAARRDPRLAKAGVEMFPGDIFEVLPEGPFDIVACSGLTPTFNEDQNLEFFRRAISLLSPGGALLILTVLRGSRPVVSSLSIQMLVMEQASGAHTEECYRQWLADVGYRKVEKIDIDDWLHDMLLATA